MQREEAINLLPAAVRQIQMDLEQLLYAYETDVRFPDVSGMEHLQMLMTRSTLEEKKGGLNAEQKERLAIADEQLIRQIGQFYVAIKRIADLSAWRKKQDAPISHWWWYLDVLTHVPSSLRQETAAAEAFG